MEIKYTYPIAEVNDLQARLMLDGVAVSDWETATAYTIQGIHAGYVVEFEDVEANAIQWSSASQDLADEKALSATMATDGLATLTKQEEILTAIDNIATGSVPQETIEKIDFIYDKFNHTPPDRGVVLVPDASEPEMVTLVVQLRDAPNMANGLKATATMLEPNPVYLDYAWEVKKEYDDITGEHTDANGTHQGVALIELFSSPKLEAAGYDPLYQVVAPGVRRTVWVPEGGGRLGELPEEKPPA